jgi:hypothetical protein
MGDYESIFGIALKDKVMSGILLPGQDRQPKSEGKIELPKGFTTPKKDERTQEQAAPENKSETPQAPTQPPAGNAPRARGQRQPGAELLFPPRGAQIRCPNCGTPYVVPVFTIVDLGANPELRGALLGGQLNVASCPNCGAGGPLGAPLLVHDPEHNFLGVFVPMESGRDDLQRQKAIGELTQTLMRKIPAESRKGYMLQPTQFVDWQRFMEKLWEFEGVTPEMLRRQRDQSSLLQRLVGLVNDDKALEIALERSASLVDRDFFNLLDQLVLMGRSQGQSSELELLLKLREKLLDMTPAGKQVKQQQEKIRSLLGQITPATTREQLVDIIVDAWMGEEGQQVVGTLAVAAPQLFDYQFLMTLSERIGGAATAEVRRKLEELRQFMVQMQEQLAARQQQTQESMAQQVQALLQEVLQANDTEAALREHADEIDETFLSFLVANIQQAEKSKASAAVRRLRAVYDQAVKILQESMPADLQLLNRLLTAPDEATVRQLLKDQRTLVTPEFVESLKPLEAEMRESGRAELADRIKSLRAQMTLMV